MLASGAIRKAEKSPISAFNTTVLLEAIYPIACSFFYLLYKINRKKMEFLVLSLSLFFLSFCWTEKLREAMTKGSPCQPGL